MHSLLPVLAVFARILVAFSAAFWVPMAWSWFLDAHHHTLVWVLTFAMLLGRLELLTVLVLFTSHFWRK